MFRVILVGLLFLSTTAVACQTKTIIIDGKVTICTVCPDMISCN